MKRGGWGAVFSASTALLCVSASPSFAQTASVNGAGDNRLKRPAALGTPNSARGVARKQGLSPAAPNAPLPSRPAVRPASINDAVPGPFLLAPGVAMTLSYTEESAGNPYGGIRQGAAYTGQAFLGLDFDMQRLANIQGGSVHFILTQRHGNNLAADYIGNNTSVQEVFGTQNAHLAQLTYEQKFFDNRVDLEIGRTVANISFLSSPFYCSFQSNAICGNPTFIFKNSNFTYFPASSWGSHVRFAITDKIFFHVGAYEVNPSDKLPTDNGFNFGVAQATGATIPFELGYATDFTNDTMPRHYGIGGYYDASRYTDPYIDVNGNAAVLSGLPYETHFGRSGFYARFDQMIWRPDPDSTRGLTLFGIYMQNVTGYTQEDQFLSAGLLQTGTFHGRDSDTIGLLATDQRFSNLFLRNIIAARTSLGGSASVPRDEIMLELNYGYQVNSSIRITPNLQYIINPDQSAEPFRQTNIPNARVIGCKATIDISTLMNYAVGR